MTTSRIWFLFPIFFGIIGGLIVWICLHEKDPYVAKRCIGLGVVLTVHAISGMLVVIFGHPEFH